MQSSSVADEVKAWLKSNKGGAVSVSFVSAKGADAAVVDLDGYEARLSRKAGAVLFETEDEDAGFQSLADHMRTFCAARARTVHDSLKEAVRAFPKHVNEDDNGDDEEGGGDSGAASEEAEIAGWVDEEPVKKIKKTPADHVDPTQFHTPNIARGAATQRLIADFAALRASDSKAIGFVAEPFETADGKKNLYKWYVRMYPPSDSDLYKDLQKVNKKSIFSRNKGQQEECIELEMLFPCEYPNDPPFIRVLQPRFALRSGHVTIGGSICMDLLTQSGWSPVNSIESILIQIRTEMVEGGGRLDLANQRAYTVEEAKEAFVRVAGQHGWKVPDMKNLPWDQ